MQREMSQTSPLADERISIVVRLRLHTYRHPHCFFLPRVFAGILSHDHCYHKGGSLLSNLLLKQQLSSAVLVSQRRLLNGGV